MNTLSKNSILSSILVLTDCSYPPVKDHDSYLYSVPVGSTLSLNKAITIPATLARRYFQNGSAVSKKAINIYYPHCSLLMNTLVDYERTIEASRYEIYKIIDAEEYAQRNIHYASTALFTKDGPSLLAYTSYYYLRSAVDSDVRSLECTQWGYPADTHYLSINEIKQSLGDYFTLRLNE